MPRNFLHVPCRQMLLDWQDKSSDNPEATMPGETGGPMDRSRAGALVDSPSWTQASVIPAHVPVVSEKPLRCFWSIRIFPEEASDIVLQRQTFSATLFVPTKSESLIKQLLYSTKLRTLSYKAIDNQSKCYKMHLSVSFKVSRPEIKFF